MDDPQLTATVIPEQLPTQLVESPGKSYRREVEQNVFDSPVLGYEITPLGMGGESLVFSVTDHPEIVVKGNKYLMREIIKADLANRVSITEFPEYMRGMVDEYMATERRRLSAFRQYFGREHTLNQKKYFMEVPVTEHILQSHVVHRLDLRGQPLPKTAWTCVTVQKKTDIFGRKDSFGITASYAEQSNSGWRLRKDFDSNSYNELNRLLFQRDSEFDLELFFKIQAKEGTRLKEFFEKIKSDQSFSEIVKDFVERTVKYSNETKEILDIQGGDNVLFEFDAKKSEWRYLMVDALYPGGLGEDGRIMDIVHQGLRKLVHSEPLDEGEGNILMNAINFARTINALAITVGSDSRIEFVPEDLKNIDIDFYQAIKDYMDQLSKRKGS